MDKPSSEERMLAKGAAKKVTIYVNEDTRHHMDALWSSVLRFLHSKHVSGASVIRVAAGFWPRSTLPFSAGIRAAAAAEPCCPALRCDNSSSSTSQSFLYRTDICCAQ